MEKMKSLMLLWQRTAQDAAVQCRTSADRDIERVTARFEHEGLEILTLGLPAIGKEFEYSLDICGVAPSLLSLTGAKRGFPVLFQGFLELVFDRASGCLLDKPSPDAIQAVRQLTLMFSKVGLPCSDAREAQAFEDFVKCEQELRDAIYEPSSSDYAWFRHIANVLFGDVLNRLDRDVYNGEIVPKHGPGATADKLKGNRKYQQEEWTSRLESVFPSREFLIPNERYHSYLDTVQFLEPDTERPVKVISVPKTQKTPRIIAIEPTAMQYAQQGLMEKFVEYLESDSVVQDMIGFTDQTPNQRMAREGSITGELATLDLSEASDRVSVKLVQSMLLNQGYLCEAVLACRSTKADVPGHGVIPLTKFASMGSALTFPIEEMVFLTAIFYGIMPKGLDTANIRDTVKYYRKRVRVYGDDIIIPVEVVPDVVSALNHFGFKVNDRKSFWMGTFRESCGKEYWDGHDVSIFRVRSLLPTQRTDAAEVISTVSLRNQAYQHGYWGVARYLDTLLEGLIPFPNVLSTSSVLGRHSHLGYSQDRECPDLQRPLVRGMIVRSRIPSSPLEDEFALLKWFLKRGAQPFADARHLERQGRPQVVGMKLGWACPY